MILDEFKETFFLKDRDHKFLKTYDKVNDSLSDSVNSTYQAIKANPGIQRKRISELTGKSIPTIDRHLAFLAKSNLIEHRDSDKTSGYYVKKDEEEVRGMRDEVKLIKEYYVYTN